MSALATLSIGETIAGPKADEARHTQLRRLSQQFSRQLEAAKVRAGLQPGQPIPQGMPLPQSKNMAKPQCRIARLHAQIAHIRENAWQPLTTMLGQRVDVIALEDLNVAGMLKNHKLARAIADRGLGECRRQWEYKAAQRGKPVVGANRWYPSSTPCSQCGHHVPTMPLSVRAWTCPQCQAQPDRAVNAAMNWRHAADRSSPHGESSMGSYSSVSASRRPAR